MSLHCCDDRTEGCKQGVMLFPVDVCSRGLVEGNDLPERAE